MQIPDIVKLLNMDVFIELVQEAYLVGKDYLDEELQEVDDNVMISYARAYIINEYEKQITDKDKIKFIDEMQTGFLVINLMDEFIKILNSTKAKMGDLVNKDVLLEIEELENYKDTDIYKELSKNDKLIADIIKGFHGYQTIEELKEKCHDEPVVFGNYKEYIISEEEIRIIESTKKHYMPNQMAHLLFDEKKGSTYYCDHEIKSEDEKLKKLLVSTNRKDSPIVDILFKDGVIVEYNKGDIRLKPYTFNEIVEYTKLFLTQNYDEIIDSYENKGESDSYQIGRQAILNAFVHVYTILGDLEDIYTQKMIKNAEKDLVKIKEISKKYDL